MTAIVDPRRTRLPPESIIESINTAAVGTSNAIVGSYQCDPFVSTLENFQIESTANLDMVLAIDGAAESEKLRSNAVVPITDDHTGDRSRLSKFTAKRTAEVALRMALGAAANVYSRYNVTTRAPTVLDKIMLGMDLTSEEEQLATEYNLYDKISAGVIPRYVSLIEKCDVYKMFDRIREYPVLLAALAATTNTTVGYQIDVPQETVYVLLGISIDSTQFAGVFSDTFLCVDIDGIANYMRLDCSGLPVNAIMPCYIPFVQKMLVRVESTTGSGGNTVACNYIIGRRKATIVDHLKWGDKFPVRNTVDQMEMDKILTKYEQNGQNLRKMIKAGLM
jgi:hypothetical protein